MSYAAAAARGPSQSPKEAAAPQPPQVEVADVETSTSSLIDVDSPHVNTVPSNFESQKVKTSTQAERIEREKEEKRLEKELKEKAKAAAEHSKAKAKSARDKLSANKSNPVLVTNAILITLASAGLGYGAYQKYLKGALTWETVAWWSGGIGAVGLADYMISRWFVKNKYPAK